MQRVVFATTPLGEAVDVSEGPLGELLQYLQVLKDDCEGLGALAGELEPLRQKLPPELTQELNFPIASDADGMRELLDDVRQILTHRFVSRGETK